MKVVGHRGARGLAPENTLVSINKAIEHHVDMIEIDLRVTKDKVVVLHHGASLTSHNGNKYEIKDNYFELLKQQKTDLTRLSDVLDSISNNVALYLEVKSKVDVKPIVKALSKYSENPHKNIWLASKNQKTLLKLHSSLPNIPKIVIEPWSGIRACKRAKQVSTNIISMNQLWLWRGFITPISRRGWHLYAYTLNNPQKAERWNRYGLYGVITDYPDLFDKIK